MLKKSFFIFYFFILFLNAEPVIINNSDSQVSILEHAKFFIDSSSKLTLKEVKKKEFKNTNTDYLRLGYTDDTLWIKFSIKNNSKEKLEKYITITNPMIDTIELYTKTSNKYIKETQGILHLDLYERNNILHPSFKINFKADETKDFYYKTHSITCANYFKLFIKDINKVYKDEFSYQLIEALFSGAILALILYNLSIFIFTREMSYFYYIMYLLFVLINYSSSSIMIDYIIGVEYSHIDAFLAVYYLSFANIFALLFIQNILYIKKYKFLNQSINILILISIITMIVSTQNNYLIEISTHITFTSMILVLFLTIFSLIKNHPLSKYIFIAWFINILGLFSLALTQYGIISFIDLFPYFYELTVFLEAIIFSVVLASKLNKTKELEESVKTNEVLTRELHHRVKNNMQFIILMYRLKLANLTTPQIDQKLSEIEGSIQAMSKTHEILYNQENLSDIDTKLYFENLIEEMKRSFDTSKIKISLEISTTMDTQTSIYCGIILNELMTNSFKYAFENKQGRIDISLEKSKNKYIFIIKDSGIGFDYDKKKDESFGLSFVHEMVRNELKGKLEFINHKGSELKITF